MKTLYISVTSKVATSSARNKIVCGNSDYQIQFTFDSEWDAHEKKTARFVVKDTYKDVEFTGTICPVPPIINTDTVSVGVFVGDLSTTTPATIHCMRSVRCSGAPAEGFPIYEKGEKGDTGEKGDKGDNGLSPHIGSNGNWWIGETDMGVKAQGPKGDTGDMSKDYAHKSFTNALRGKVSGTVLSMDDVSPLAHKIPVNLSSKNLIPYPYTYTTNTKDGITAIDNGDGSVTISGKAEKMCYFVVIRNGNLPTGTYTLSGVNNAPSGIYLQASGVDANGAVYSYPVFTNGSKTFDAIYGITAMTLFIPAGAEVENFTFKPQLELGTVATAYVPYVADDAQVTIKSCGSKNLLNGSLLEEGKTVNGVTVRYVPEEDAYLLNGEATATAAITIDASIDCYIQDNLTISCEYISGTSEKGTGDYFPNFYVDSSDVAGGTVTNWYSIALNNGSQYKTAKEARPFLRRCRFYIVKGNVLNNYKCRIMVEKGATATEYEPYKNGETVTTTIADGAELNSVSPNMTIYTDTAGVSMECQYGRDINIAISREPSEPGTSLDPENFATKAYVETKTTEAKAYADEKISATTTELKRVDMRVAQLETVAIGKLYTTTTATFMEIMGEGYSNYHNWYMVGSGTLETYLHTALLNKLTIYEHSTIPSVLFDYPISTALAKQLETAKEQLAKYYNSKVVCDFINKTVNVTGMTSVSFNPTLDTIGYFSNNDGTYTFSIWQHVVDYDWSDDIPTIEVYADYWFWEGMSNMNGDGDISGYSEYGDVYIVVTVPCDSDASAEVIKTDMVNGEFSFDVGIGIQETLVEDMQTSVDEPYITLWQESDIETHFDYGRIINIYAKIDKCDPSDITITAMKKVV